MLARFICLYGHGTTIIWLMTASSLKSSTSQHKNSDPFDHAGRFIQLETDSFFVYQVFLSLYPYRGGRWSRVCQGVCPISNTIIAYHVCQGTSKEGNNSNSSESTALLYEGSYEEWIYYPLYDSVQTRSKGM